MKKVSNLPDKAFKVMVIKMLTKIGKRIDELEKRENEKIYQREIRELKNITTYLKNTLKGFKNRLDKAERLVIWKTGQWNSSKQGSNKQNPRILKSRNSLGDQGDNTENNGFQFKIVE